MKTYKLYNGSKYAIFTYIVTDMDDKPLAWAYNPSVQSDKDDVLSNLHLSIHGHSGLYKSSDFYMFSIIDESELFLELL